MNLFHHGVIERSTPTLRVMTKEGYPNKKKGTTPPPSPPRSPPPNLKGLH